ncbi:MAG: hypothetical protein H6808_00030 [Phycisphaera sp.]|nr:hypothetical protein [Phycisphaera sp.]
MVEALVVVCLAAVLLAVCLPTIREHRRQASIKADLGNMRLIGQTSAMYSGANAGRLFTFSWVPGQVPVTPNAELAIACAMLNPNDSGASVRASMIQNLDLVTYGFKDERLPPLPDLVPSNTLPFISYNHLVLARFLGQELPWELFISHGDKHRSYWLNNLDTYLDDPAASPARPPTASEEFVRLWRYPFSSSYEVGVSHFSNDTGNTGNPRSPMTAERGNGSRSWRMPSSPGVLGRRSCSEIAYPSMKVMMYDEFDRYNAAGYQYFGLSTSSSIMNFYDGHAARLDTADANFGFWPNNPGFGADEPDQPSAQYSYLPFAGWDPPDAVDRVVPVRYDQTRNGLQGIDYPGK